MTLSCPQLMFYIKSMCMFSCTKAVWRRKSPINTQHPCLRVCEFTFIICLHLNNSSMLFIRFILCLHLSARTVSVWDEECWRCLSMKTNFQSVSYCCSICSTGLKVRGPYGMLCVYVCLCACSGVLRWCQGQAKMKSKCASQFEYILFLTLTKKFKSSVSNHSTESCNWLCGYKQNPANREELLTSFLK